MVKFFMAVEGCNLNYVVGEVNRLTLHGWELVGAIQVAMDGNNTQYVATMRLS